MPKVNHGSAKYRTQLPIGTPELWDRAYRALEAKAAAHMQGWTNVRGSTPDDLAQKLWAEFVSHLGTRSFEDAIRIAGHGLKQDVINLQSRIDNEVRGVELDPDLVPDDESVIMYLDPDRVDWLSDNLSPRELQVVIARFEDMSTQSEIAEDLGLSEKTVQTLLRRALTKLQEVETHPNG